MMTFTATREQRDNLEGLAYWVSDRAWSRERGELDEHEDHRTRGLSRRDARKTDRTLTEEAADVGNTQSFDFYIYSRPDGERRFTLTDLARGTVGLGKFYAPRYSKEQLDQLKKWLDMAAATYPGAVFQVRRLDGKTVVYTTR